MSGVLTSLMCGCVLGARAHCANFFSHYNTADLAMPTSPERNAALQKVVDETRSPHWLGAHNSMHGDTNSHRPPTIEKPDFKESHVDWLYTGANGVGHFHGKKHLNFKNWDAENGQPDDADGKEHFFGSGAFSKVRDLSQ